ncbi:MAG: DUF6498-containing protein [Pseudomonadota bacterium]
MNVSDTLVALRTLAGETVLRTGASVIVLFAANTTVLLLCIAYELTGAELVVVYWWESLWIGGLCIVKTVTAVLLGGAGQRPRTAAMGTIVAVIFSASVVLSLVGLAIQTQFGDAEPLNARMPSWRDLGMLFGVSLILLSGHTFSFLVNFLALGEFKTARHPALVRLPWLRSAPIGCAIAVLVAAGLVLPAVTASWRFAALLAILKLLLDYRMHLHERRSLNVL